MEESILEKKREVSSEWHYNQVLDLLKFDKERNLDNVLVYSALELRCCIERLIFEILFLICNIHLTIEEEKKCNSYAGIFSLLKEKEPHYRKRAIFTNLIASVDRSLPQVAVFNFRVLKNHWQKLSKYCHKQLDPQKSFNSKNRHFQREGFILIKEIVNYLQELGRNNAFGIIQTESMPKEIKEIYNDFIDGKIDEESTKIRLELSQPLLELKRKKHRIWTATFR